MLTLAEFVVEFVVDRLLLFTELTDYSLSSRLIVDATTHVVKTSIINRATPVYGQRSLIQPGAIMFRES